MASGKSNFKTPDQPNRVKRGVIDPSPNLNLVYQTLPDLTPPRKNKYSDPFSTIGVAGASPSGTEFGFPRPNDSSPGAFRSGGDGKSDPSFDLFGFRSTPAKGRSPGFDLSSPRSTGLHPPPVPIFQPSPRRASNASTYISPESRNRRSSLASSSAGGKAFSFSPQPAFASPPPTGAGGGGAGTSAGATNNMNGGHASFTSVFASILGDAHSRISPTNLSAAAAAARDGSAVRAHFGGIFTAADAAAGGGSSNGNNGAGGASGSGAQPGNTMLVPVDGLHPSGGSPLQLHQTTPVSAAANSEDDNGEDDEDGDDNDGYDAVAARRPSRRRALDFDRAAVAGAGGSNNVNGNTINNNNNNINGPNSNDNDDNGLIKYEIPNPLSPSMGPVVIDSIEALLPIPRLRDSSGEESGEGDTGAKDRPRGPVLVPSSTRGVSGTTAGGVSLLPGLTRGGASNGGAGMSFMDSLAQSPISMRPGIIRREDIIDSPAVKEATNAAVAAAMQANAEKRPARAAAAGAAAAAAAAGGTPMSRRPSAAHHAAGNVDSGLFDASGLLSITGSAVPAGGVRCNCKKSRCMKLYCDCFKTLGYCGDGCSCVGCSNREDNAPAVNEARESILQRNPQAFSEKISTGMDTGDALLGDGFGSGSGNLGINSGGGGGIFLQAQHRRGCNCKKSKCLKKYCECFQAGIPCGDSCKCCGCHNTTEAMAAGKPPFDKKRIQQQQQQQQQSAPTLPSLHQQIQQQQIQQQQQHKVALKTPSGEESTGGSGSGSGSDDGGVKLTSASVPAKTTSGGASVAAAAAAPGMQQFAALGPAFQQILLQQALSRNGGAVNGTVAAGAVGANGGTPPPGGHTNGKQGALTVNNQLLVPISWPIAAAAAAAAAGAANGGGAGIGAGAANATTAQQLLTLAASNANTALSNQFAAAIAAAQKNAANVAAAAAATAAAAAKNTHGSNGKATPSVGPSSEDEHPSSAQAAGTTTTTTATDQQQQPSDGLEAPHEGRAPKHAALLQQGNRRKPPLPLASPLPLGGATTTPASLGERGTSNGDEERPRLTPTKRKPARTMTAALS